MEVIARIDKEIKLHIDRVLEIGEKFTFEDYIEDQLPRAVSVKSKKLDNPKIKLIRALRNSFDFELENGAYIIGEDIHDPLLPYYVLAVLKSEEVV